MALLLLNACAILAVVIVLHRYLYRRLVADVSFGWWRRIGAVLLGLLLVMTIAVLIAGPYEAPFELSRVLAVPGLLWLTPLLYLTVALLFGEIVRPLLRNALARRAARSRARPDAGAADHGASDRGAVDRGADDRGVDDGGALGPAPAGSVVAPTDTDMSRRVFVARTVAIGSTTVAALATAESMAGSPRPPGPGLDAVEILLPFAGRWSVRNSPARQVPSHGTNLFGSSYAIDFVGVDEHHRTAGSSSWRTMFATEPPELFFAFGVPVLAPGDGTVVAIHDGELDHEARRSRLALVPYMLGQAGRLADGVPGLAGNHVVIALRDSGAYATLCHLRRGSLRVVVGQQVTAGEHVANCGNSGNSTQPHVHIQLTNTSDLEAAKGVPMVFRRFREWPSGSKQPRLREHAIPEEDSVVESVL
ncbi:M23 family metallopeptidase [Kribbella solani]|uniref:M23 family metallopeptidase n=1 Tax=Kribbella solani TaxID=236067 RepID=UPI0029AB44CF|nr:M23 family metallopeptidase [Kribbella solani]MDX2971765.1 M23 family metallopeptidase [Kribbella solani]